MKHNLIGIEISPKGAEERRVKTTGPGKRKSGKTLSVKVTDRSRRRVWSLKRSKGADGDLIVCAQNRTMYLHVSQLHLSNDVNPLRFGDDNLAFGTGDASVRAGHGPALEDSSISVMGDPGNKVRAR